MSKPTQYLLVIKLLGSVFITNHTSLESLEREIFLVQRDNSIKLKYIDYLQFEEECCFSEYPEASAVKIPVRAKDRETASEPDTYVSPFTGKVS